MKKGSHHTEESKKKISKNHARFYGEDNPMKRPDVKAKHEAIMRDPDFRAKRSKIMLEVMNRPEVKEKQKEASNREDVKRKRSESAKKVQNRPDIAEKRNAMVRSKEFRDMLRQNMMGDKNPVNRFPELRKANAERLRSPEIREKALEGLRRPEVRKKISDSKKGDKNPMKRPENRKKISNRPAHPKSGFGKGSYYQRNDGSLTWLRSTYETRVAIILDQRGIEWMYEVPITINDQTWHPDFYLPQQNMFIEVKGYLLESSYNKMKSFSEFYQDERLLVVEEDDIKNLEDGKSFEVIGTELSEYIRRQASRFNTYEELIK